MILPRYLLSLLILMVLFTDHEVLFEFLNDLFDTAFLRHVMKLLVSDKFFIFNGLMDTYVHSCSVGIHLNKGKGKKREGNGISELLIYF
jgi:hypothetical protein